MRMLVEEVEKRSQVRWPVTDAWPEKAGAVIVVGPSQFANDVLAQHQVSESPRFDAAEGYRLRVVDAKPPIVMVAGNDSRGVLFGVGRLAPRAADSRRRVLVPGILKIASGPKYRAPRASARLSAEDEFVRRLVGADVGAVHPRSGGLRHQRGRADSAAHRRRGRQPAFSAAADADDGRDVAAAGPVRPRRLDLVSGDGRRLFQSRDGGEGPRRMGRRLPAVAADRRGFRSRRRSGPHRPGRSVAVLEKQTANLHRYHPQGADVGLAAELQPGVARRVHRVS